MARRAGVLETPKADLKKERRLPTMARHVVELMRRDIIVGDFPRGEFLSEAKLAEKYHTSRTPVREACIHLYKEGFLHATPHKGYVVSEISIDDVHELDQLRLILEPALAALAASNKLGPEHVADCHRILERYELAARRDRTYETFVELCGLEYEFHHVIAQGSGNKKGAKVIREIMNQYQRFYYLCFRKYPRMEIAHLPEHGHILEVIEARDPSRARQAMYEHLNNGARRHFLVLSGPAGRGESEECLPLSMPSARTPSADPDPMTLIETGQAEADEG